MRIAYAIQGALFALALIGLVFIIKIGCPVGAGQGCFSDYFTVPMFMPLGFIYKFFGEVPVVYANESIFILLYWALVGLLIGLCFDLFPRKNRF